jgi:hypothetical protein
VSTQRLSLTRNGRIRYQLKTPYNDGTTHVIFEPLDFIAKLVAWYPSQESTSPATTEYLHPKARIVLKFPTFTNIGS